jgi:hypothetical protein
MRNVLLGLSIALVLLNGSASAQIVTQIGKDTAKGTYDGSVEIAVYNRLKSASATPVYLKWNVIPSESHFDAGWSPVGFCDNIFCYSGNDIFVSGNMKKSAAYDNTTFSGTNHDFHMIFGTPTAPANGTSAIVRVSARDTVSFDQRTFTFIGYKDATGVSNISSSDDIIMYPIPAREALNVVFDSKDGIKTIAVYNLIGKLVGPIYRTSSNISAKIALDDMPTGVYFLRLMDAQGHVIATRRFTHQ